MKKRVVFKVGKFVDFTGKEREVVFAAVSQELEDTTADTWTTCEDLFKEVRIGISVQNPKDDVVNTELGKIIAEGKALKEKSCFGKLFATDKGFINKTVVDALLSQEVDYFKQNPGKYLAGYNKDKELYRTDPLAYFSKMGTPIIDVLTSA